MPFRVEKIRTSERWSVVRRFIFQRIAYHYRTFQLTTYTIFFSSVYVRMYGDFFQQSVSEIEISPSLKEKHKVNACGVASSFFQLVSSCSNKLLPSLVPLLAHAEPTGESWRLSIDPSRPIMCSTKGFRWIHKVCVCVLLRFAT